MKEKRKCAGIQHLTSSQPHKHNRSGWKPTCCSNTITEEKKTRRTESFNSCLSFASCCYSIEGYNAHQGGGLFNGSTCMEMVELFL